LGGEEHTADCQTRRFHRRLNSSARVL
jgi:hypothetical protein